MGREVKLVLAVTHTSGMNSTSIFCVARACCAALYSKSST